MNDSRAVYISSLSSKRNVERSRHIQGVIRAPHTFLGLTRSGAGGGGAGGDAYEAFASRRYLLCTGPRVVFNGRERDAMGRDDRGRHVARASYISVGFS